ncbi:MAG: hypothetical protein VX599_03705 [Pseudomonadota bacterium]|nr:hypothetical protein [Pseudomonadota bacterium]
MFGKPEMRCAKRIKFENYNLDLRLPGLGAGFRDSNLEWLPAFFGNGLIQKIADVDAA